MQYSVFTHGTSLRIESPEAIARFAVAGWGTILWFKPPIVYSARSLPILHSIDDEPGTWCHISIPCTHETFGKYRPQLQSVTLLVDATRCHISKVHVYDGYELLEEFNGELSGNYLFTRNLRDLNPKKRLPVFPNEPVDSPNTYTLSQSRKLFSAVGISFYACINSSEFDEHEDSLLTFAAAGAQYYIPDPPINILLAKVVQP